MTIAEVRSLIAQHLGIDAGCVTDEALFRDDLGADSLDAFELLMTFEDVAAASKPPKGDVRIYEHREAGGLPGLGWDAFFGDGTHRAFAQ